MTTTDTNRANYQILQVVYKAMLKIVHENAAACEEAVIRAAEGQEPEGLPKDPLLESLLASRQIRENEGTGKIYNVFVQRQLRIIYELIEYLDQSIGPVEWPGVDLVNFTTRERLSDDFAFDFAEAEQEFIDELRKANLGEE